MDSLDPMLGTAVSDSSGSAGAADITAKMVALSSSLRLLDDYTKEALQVNNIN